MTIRATIINISIASAILLFLVAIGFISFSNYQGDKLERLITHDLAFSRAIDQTYSIGLRAGIALRTAVINPQDKIATSTFEEARKAFTEKINESRKINSGQAGLLMGEAAELWAESEPLKTQIMQLVQEGKRDQAMLAIDEDSGIFREIKSILDDAREVQNKELAHAIKANRDIIFKGRLAVAGFLLTGIFGMIWTVMIMFRRILRPLDTLVSAVTMVGTGDLSHTIQFETKDELGKLADEFNSMVAKLGNMVVKLRFTSGELQSASTQIAETARQVVQSYEIQVTSVDDTSSAVTEITASIQNVAKSVDILSDSAIKSSSSTAEMAANIEEVSHNMEGLDKSVAEVSCSVIEMAAAINQINGNVQQLSEISLSTASSIAEMDSSIKEVKLSALDTVSISGNLLIDAESGKKTVEATIAGIHEIRQASGLTIEAITSLESNVADIGKILLVIDDVAEQTNLLALNASIIAAQAGPHGKGFAVVANEIKELADRTKLSTNEIANVIKAVQSETHRAASTIGVAESSIANGERLSKESEGALQKIVVGIKLSTERMNHIAKATSEQAQVSQMIHEAMDQVSQMVKHIARATSEQGKGSEIIMASVENMKILTGDVNNATKEQADTSNFIAKVIEQTSTMIGQIKQATGEQNLSSNQIVRSMATIQATAGSNATATKALDGVISKLSLQVQVLQEEMANFRL